MSHANNGGAALSGHVAAEAMSAEAVTVQTTAVDGSEGRVVEVLEAKMRGFEGDSCAECGNFTLVRNGTCMKCVTCGATTGCS